MSAFPTGPCAFPNVAPTITTSTADSLATLGLMGVSTSLALTVIFLIFGGVGIGRRRRRSADRYERSTGETSNIHLDMLASFLNGTIHTFERHPEMIGLLINGTVNTIQSFPEYHKKHRSHHRAKRQAPVGCLTIALPLVDLPPPPPVLPLLSLPAPSLPLPVLPILPVLPVLGLLPILITTTTTTTTTTTPCVDASTTGNCALLPSLPVALATALCSGGLGTTLCQKTCDDVVGGYC